MAVCQVLDCADDGQECGGQQIRQQTAGVGIDEDDAHQAPGGDDQTRRQREIDDFVSYSLLRDGYRYRSIKVIFNS